MDTLVRKIISDTPDEFAKDIVTFQEEYGTKTTFEELNIDQLRTKLWEQLICCLLDDARSSTTHQQCLSTLRILSRDKTDINECTSDERINLILNYAALGDASEHTPSTSVIIESLKLLSNLIYNSTYVQQKLETPCLFRLIDRMRKYNSATSSEMMFFDTRIVFLITALKKDTQSLIKDILRGDECLIKILENISTQCEQEKTNTIKVEDALLACEVMAALFNLYMNPVHWTDKDNYRMKNLISILYKLLLFECEKCEDLQRNITNLLMVAPYSCYSTIIPPAQDTGKHVFQNTDMQAVSILLKFLDKRLDCKDDLIGNLSAIVTTFIRMVKAEKLIRKYTRMQILPPLKDVMHRPEEGTTLRAKLCKLLTSPLTQLRDLVAEFLFILCKENVSRMVKYTGYGNAAGMFANKGLLGLNREKAGYSSESEDSETEEYLQHKEQINPVTGCFEHPKPNPLEGMSEERKEYEALQLVGLIDQLTRQGLVQPCRIGDDGKPQPVEHVLELQKQPPRQQYYFDLDDSD
ncbi:PREDICTED: synembryn-A isoform X2 [Dufourea novaeangliae]|uniref:Synembryn-A n=1 Tax=Dufourea novaeangliae TaxID=178035 RepID=A0A154PAL8_DUFNO|nr:PREDICTED: synembryn-A isoform X2 [Dufourea novaeangliae]KZC08881.1 Synembryn-A [Dufourea novaeangliae]